MPGGRAACIELARCTAIAPGGRLFTGCSAVGAARATALVYELSRCRKGVVAATRYGNETKSGVAGENKGITVTALIG